MRRILNGCQHCVTRLDHHLIGDWEAVLSKMPLLLVLILDLTDSPPRWMHGYLLYSHRAVCTLDPNGVLLDILKDLALDVLDLDGQDVTAKGGLPDLDGISKGADNVAAVVDRLLRWRILFVQNNNLNPRASRLRRAFDEASHHQGDI